MDNLSGSKLGLATFDKPLLQLILCDIEQVTSRIFPLRFGGWCVGRNDWKTRQRADNRLM